MNVDQNQRVLLLGFPKRRLGERLGGGWRRCEQQCDQ
jgi:hypothetical protein